MNSLPSHFDQLQSLLVNLNDKFCVSEFWDSVRNHVSTKVNISVYSFFSTKSKSQNGDVDLYVRLVLDKSRAGLAGCFEEDVDREWPNHPELGQKNVT